MSLAVLSGGRSNTEKGKQELARQEAMLRDLPDVIVATPAGLLTHIRSGVLDLASSVETLVVDEADLVLSFGKYCLLLELSYSLFVYIFISNLSWSALLFQVTPMTLPRL